MGMGGGGGGGVLITREEQQWESEKPNPLIKTFTFDEVHIYGKKYYISVAILFRRLYTLVQVIETIAHCRAHRLDIPQWTSIKYIMIIRKYVWEILLIRHIHHCIQFYIFTPPPIHMASKHKGACVDDWVALISERQNCLTLMSSCT